MPAIARRIDVHHHILPTEYVATVGEKTIGPPAPNRDVPKWDVLEVHRGDGSQRHHKRCRFGVCAWSSAR